MSVSSAASPRQVSEYECPICYEPLLPPIYQCFNGHLLCGKCIERVSACPCCRDALPVKKIKALAVENLVRDSRRPCPFSKLGCKELLHNSRSSFEEHQFHCFYSALKYCSLLGLECGESLTKGNILEHLICSHNVPYFTYNYGEELRIDENLFPPSLLHNNYNNFAFDDTDVDGKGKYHRLAVIQTKDETFALKCLENPHELVISWTLLILGSEKMARQYDVSIKLLSADNSHAYSEHSTSLEWKGLTSHIKLNENDSGSSSKLQDLFSVPYKYFPALISLEEGTGKLKWKIVLQIRNNVFVEEEIPVLNAQHPDRAPAAEVQVVHDAYCNGCNLGNNVRITGSRFKCMVCPDFDLCGHCMMRKLHPHHLFAVITDPDMLNQYFGLLPSKSELSISNLRNNPFTDPTVVHFGAFCDECQNDAPLTGPRYKCLECLDYDLCHDCMRKQVHAHHLFVIIPYPHMRSQLVLAP